MARKWQAQHTDLGPLMSTAIYWRVVLLCIGVVLILSAIAELAKPRG
jgi:hypothetical protein